MGIKAPPGAPQRHNNELCWVELCFVVCEYVWRMYVCIKQLVPQLCIQICELVQIVDST